MKSKLIVTFLSIFISLQVVKASQPGEKKSNKEIKGVVIEVIPVGEGKFKLFCKGAGYSPVYVSISNRISGLLIEDKIDIRKDFARTYDLSKFKKDIYTFEVSTDSKRVYQEVAFFDQTK